MRVACWPQSSAAAPRGLPLANHSRKSVAWPTLLAQGGSTFSDVGVFTIYAGTSPEHLNQVLDLSLLEMRRVVSEAFPMRN